MGLKIENIKKPAKIKRNTKRVGRGIGSGRGKTSGRGHKGALSRAGGGYSEGFEGGQMPLIRRVPKRGFNNKWKKEWNVVNIGVLERSDVIGDGSVVDKKILADNRILRKKKLPLKVLGKGELKKKLTVKADAVSEGARKAIEKAGGKVEIQVRS
ncbi:MAG: 50S ribosomal protein L15 [Candidatus Omnitrophica bacterium]|nr:50S ribosomal protein L15 [Candidatus Omnitrophota bacterium]